MNVTTATIIKDDIAFACWSTISGPVLLRSPWCLSPSSSSSSSSLPPPAAQSALLPSLPFPPLQRREKQRHQDRERENAQTSRILNQALAHFCLAHELRKLVCPKTCKKCRQNIFVELRITAHFGQPLLRISTDEGLVTLQEREREREKRGEERREERPAFTSPTSSSSYPTLTRIADQVLWSSTRTSILVPPPR